MSEINSFRRDTSNSSGFKFFVKEFSLKYKIYPPFEALQTLALPYWDQLNEIEKEYYHAKAKNPKRSYTDAKNQKGFQKTSTRDNEEMNLLQSRGHVSITHDITLFLEINQCRQESHTDKLYFINASTSEFAIAVFSLYEGIIKDICIPITRTTGSNQSDDEWIEINILLKLVDFLRPLQTFPKRFFTNGNLTDDYDTFKANSRFMKHILEKAGEYDIAERVKIFPLNYLLYHMKSFIKPMKIREGLKEYPFSSLDTAQNCIKDDMDKFHPLTVACDDHEGKFNNSKCSLSFVRKSAYIIAKYYSDPSKYPMFEGIHYPTGMRADYEIAGSDFEI